MILYKKLVKEFRPFLKYAMVGASGTVIDVGALYLFVEYAHFPLLLATTLAFLLAATNNFLLNKTWTFKNKSTNYRKLFIKFMIISVIGLILTNLLMLFMVSVLGIWYILAKLLTSVVVMLWNFLGNKYWTFKLTKRLVEMLHHFEYDLSIVIPAFNEENRIKNTLLNVQDYVNEKKLNAEIIVVSDGSEDATLEIVEQKKTMIPHLKLIELENNQGKGCAVKKGIEASLGRYILFMDADHSTPIEELDKLLLVMEEKQADMVIGSRYLKKDSVKIKQSFLRVFMGRAANVLIRLFLIGGIKDTQCGFKLFRHNAAKEIFSRQKVRRWGFDMEVLVIGKMLDYQIEEVAVNWFNSTESRLRPLKDAPRTLLELFYIKLNQWSGRYR